MGVIYYTKEKICFKTNGKILFSDGQLSKIIGHGGFVEEDA
jgi:hypothetical protein